VGQSAFYLKVSQKHWSRPWQAKGSLVSPTNSRFVSRLAAALIKLAQKVNEPMGERLIQKPGGIATKASSKTI